MPYTDQEIEEEEAHFVSVVAAFRNYTAHSVKLEITGRIPPLTFGSVDLGEQQEEERFVSSSKGRPGRPRKNRI